MLSTKLEWTVPVELPEQCPSSAGDFAQIISRKACEMTEVSADDLRTRDLWSRELKCLRVSRECEARLGRSMCR
jgi:hypothetical protein